MAEIRLSQESYTDYSAAKYFGALGVSGLKMEPKNATLKTGEIVPLIHFSGVQESTGELLNFDMWPRNEATKEDLEKFPKSIAELYFRIGYATVGGTVIQSSPKWLVLNPGDTGEFKLSGAKREFVG